LEGFKMLLRFKSVFLECFKFDRGISDPYELNVDKKKPHFANSRSDTTSKTENDTAETQGFELTTGDESPRVKLVVVESNIIPVGKEFLVNSKGLETTERKKPNGAVHIGRSKLAKETREFLNDIVLDDYLIGEKHSIIKYNPNLKRYYLKDQGDGSGTFLKVQAPTKVANGTVLSLCDFHLLVEISKSKYINRFSTQDLDQEFLILKFLDGPKESQVFTFSPSDQLEVKIGRAKKCHIKFDEEGLPNSISRSQCSFKYFDGFWYICDGSNNKPSANGTWIFAHKFHEIKCGSIFKIGQSIFQASIL